MKLPVWWLRWPSKASLRWGTGCLDRRAMPAENANLCLAGDFIYCRNTLDVYGLTGNTTGRDTYAQYFLKQDWLLVEIPDDLALEHASMGCCALGPTYTAVKRMEVGPFDTVIITGLGPVGLGGVINATFRGARVIGVEPSPYRAKLAKGPGRRNCARPE